MTYATEGEDEEFCLEGDAGELNESVFCATVQQEEEGID